MRTRTHGLRIDHPTQRARSTAGVRTGRRTVDFGAVRCSPETGPVQAVSASRSSSQVLEADFKPKVAGSIPCPGPFASRIAMRNRLVITCVRCCHPCRVCPDHAPPVLPGASATGSENLSRKSYSRLRINAVILPVDSVSP